MAGTVSLLGCHQGRLADDSIYEPIVHSFLGGHEEVTVCTHARGVSNGMQVLKTVHLGQGCSSQEYTPGLCDTQTPDQHYQQQLEQQPKKGGGVQLRSQFSIVCRLAGTRFHFNLCNSVNTRVKHAPCSNRVPQRLVRQCRSQAIIWLGCCIRKPHFAKVNSKACPATCMILTCILGDSLHALIGELC